MTSQRSRELRQEVAEAAAQATLDVPGVAWIRPDLAATLRSAGTARTEGTRRALPAVELRQSAANGAWRATVDLRVALHRGHLAVATSRAVDRAVTEAAERVLPAPSRTHVTVTVTGII